MKQYSCICMAVAMGCGVAVRALAGQKIGFSHSQGCPQNFQSKDGVLGNFSRLSCVSYEISCEAGALLTLWQMWDMSESCFLNMQDSGGKTYICVKKIIFCPDLD